MMGSSSVTSVKIVGASDRKKNKQFTAALNLLHMTVGFVSENPTQRMLTDIFLCFYHLPTHSHLARSPQHVSRAVEKL